MDDSFIVVDELKIFGNAPRDTKNLNPLNRVIPRKKLGKFFYGNDIL